MGEMMVQCRLLKENKTQVAWIPLVENLKVGSIVELKSEDSEDKQGWKVLEMWSKLPKEAVQERSQDYKNTRKASDI